MGRFMGDNGQFIQDFRGIGMKSGSLEVFVYQNRMFGCCSSAISSGFTRMPAVGFLEIYLFY